MYLEDSKLKALKTMLQNYDEIIGGVDGTPEEAYELIGVIRFLIYSEEFDGKGGDE